MRRPKSTVTPQSVEHRRQYGRIKGAAATRDRAELHAFRLFPLLQEQARKGCKTLSQHAAMLMEAGILTVRGGKVWDAKRVDLILARFEKSLPREAGSRARRLYNQMTGPVSPDFTKPLRDMTDAEIENLRIRLLAHDPDLRMTIRERTAKFVEVEKWSRGSSSRILRVLDHLDKIAAGKVKSNIDPERVELLRYAATIGLAPEALVADVQAVMREAGIDPDQ